MQLPSQYSVAVKNSYSFYEKLKSKISLPTPLRHIGGGNGTVPLTLHLGSRWWSQLYAPANFPPGKNPRYTLNKGLGLDILQNRNICFISTGFVKPVFIDSAPC
jgi:hypothetical protein